MSWIQYSKATPIQQITFKETNPGLGPDWANYQIWITKKGEASRAKGQWQWTEKYATTVDREIKAMTRGDNVRSKGDLREFKTATFHLDRYK